MQLVSAPKAHNMQSPGNRMVIKHSPRLSPDLHRKLSKQTIQTCKVNIDIAHTSKQGQSSFKDSMIANTPSNNIKTLKQQISSAKPSNKEYLRTVKLFKQSNCSPSPVA